MNQERGQKQMPRCHSLSAATGRGRCRVAGRELNSVLDRYNWKTPRRGRPASILAAPTGPEGTYVPWPLKLSLSLPSVG